VSALYELSIDPKDIVKLSGIGCSSKTTNYFLNQSFGFNAVHGRMSSMATGVHLAQPQAKIIGVSGDGDTASIGLGGFLHLIRRNVPMLYIIENNGVYGLTKGQFSATSLKGDQAKSAGTQVFEELDLLDVSLSAGCGFVARGFSGNSVELKNILKTALNFKGTAVVDVISPCVAYGNTDDFSKSYTNTQTKNKVLDETYKTITKSDLHFEAKSLKNTKSYDTTNLHKARELLITEKLNKTLHTGVIFESKKSVPLNERLNLNDKDAFLNDSTKQKLSEESFKMIADQWFICE
jgi:2-oxoglutarate ferredoxin oxidoreductase subunit beta